MEKFKLYFLTTAIFCVVLFDALAQQRQQGEKERPDGSGISIQGIIQDAETSSFLEYATVSLFRQKDSSLVTGAIADGTGKFIINSVPGKYYLKIDFIAYETKVIQNIDLKSGQSTFNTGIIKLSTDVEVLEGVEVIGERSHMEMKLDKRIFHVGKDLANIGGSAADLLENVPSLTVDMDGNVSLRGVGNVRLLVDGKPSALTGISSAEALQAFPANLIERVEVVTNPSVRYDAEGTSGIINIILKKEKKLGWNGNVNVMVGSPETYQASVNMNYRRKHVNWFANYNLRYRERKGSGYMKRQFFGESTSILEQNQNFNRQQLSNGIRFGADIDLNATNTLTTTVFYRLSGGDTPSSILNSNYDINYVLQSQSYRYNDEAEVESNLDFNINYRKTFTQEGRLLTADFKYGDGTEEETSDISETGLDIQPNNADDVLYQRTGNEEQQRDIIAQIDYIHPLSDKGQIELGYKSGIRRIGNRYQVEELIDDEWSRYDKLSDDFVYDENIQAAYGLIGMTVNKFSYQLGMRAEMTYVETSLKESNQYNEKEYLNLFPTGHLSFQINEGNALQMSYSRRIRRPRFWDLNPFFNFVNDQNIRSGNPDLDPELTHSTEIGYIKNYAKGSVTSSVYYRYTDDVIQRISSIVITDEQDTVTLSQPQNLAVRESFGFEVVGAYELTKWWKIDGSVNFFRQIIDGGNLGPEFASDDVSWFARINSRFSLKPFDFQVNFNYRAPQQSTQGLRKSRYFVDLGFNKDIMKQKATISVRVRDLLNTRKWRTETYGENFFIENEFQWNSRQVTIGFNYRLNQRKRTDRERGGGDFEGGGEEQ